MAISASTKLPNNNKPKWRTTIFGQDIDILLALWANIVSWFFATFAPKYQYILVPACSVEDRNEDSSSFSSNNKTQCISIGRPGGLEQLRQITLKEHTLTIGYNVRHVSPPPFATISSTSSIPADCLILRNQYFSVNYADCTIRWGLYESAKQFVGYPIVPGFDVADIVESVSDDESSLLDNSNNNFQKGDRVFGCTLFGAYSSRILIPKVQLRKIPNGISTKDAAAIPAVSLTALYALFLAGVYPVVPNKRFQYSNRAVLIHSAAGGVGSMLVQMAKLVGMFPVVGIVGSSSKVSAVEKLGCDVVIDKSASLDFWKNVEDAVPNGLYAAIFDANGVSTLQQSYHHLSPTGRLIVYGFHSNLPIGRDRLSPWEWIQMAFRQSRMPTFDPMQMTVSNKSVLAFNLSFFAEETQLVSTLLDQVVQWLSEKKLTCPTVVEMTMEHIADAHSYIQSGKSIGKIVIRTGAKL